MFTSVVIPSRNAVDRLLYTLYSLNLQYTSFDDFEVIVMDNASTDGTAERVSRFSAHYPLRCHRSRRQLSRSQLLNGGVEKAKGCSVILLGCDMIVPREFVGTHRQAHLQDDRLVLLGIGQRRIYSVYYPRFSLAQHHECEAWLEHYPQIKRPHTNVKVVPLLEEKQITSGLPFHIGLSCADAERRQSIREKGGRIWPLFQTNHVSLPRWAFHDAGRFKTLPRKEMEQEMARRLVQSGYRFQIADKLLLLKQEHPPESTSDPKRAKKNHRMK
ncbi:glycosyltransferase family A protein [Brevibacillus sp. H7]|uniref:glycosyltransferase family A protein n=1 Tax=Brevibacillus sp. H7 TaxID=3349138 RepID=UPI00380948E8